jgi:hypothetical protein
LVLVGGLTAVDFVHYLTISIFRTIESIKN